MSAIRKSHSYFGNGRLVFRRPETAENELMMMNVVRTEEGDEALCVTVGHLVDRQLNMTDHELEKELRVAARLDEHLDEEPRPAGPVG